MFVCFLISKVSATVVHQRFDKTEVTFSNLDVIGTFVYGAGERGARCSFGIDSFSSNSCNICEAILKDRFANRNESKKRADLNLLRILSTWCVRMCEAVDLLLQGKLYNLNLEAGQSTKLLGTLSNETIDLDTDLDGSTLRLTVSKSLKSGSASGSPTWNSLELMLPNSSIKGLTAHLYQSNFHKGDLMTILQSITTLSFFVFKPTFFL